MRTDIRGFDLRDDRQASGRVAVCFSFGLQLISPQALYSGVVSGLGATMTLCGVGSVGS